MCTRGHVTGNETIIKSIINEANEEVGLELDKQDIYFIMRFKKETNQQNFFLNIFYTFTDKPLHFFKKQDSEVDELLYMNFDKFLSLIKKDTSEVMYNYYEEKELFGMLEKIVKEGD